jgi:hypothetical protein
MGLLDLSSTIRVIPNSAKNSKMSDTISPSNNNQQSGGNSSILLESMRELKNELDQRNVLALQELNRDIDQLASIPVDNLPLYKDNLETTSPPTGFHQMSTLDQDLTLQLDKDYKDFKQLRAMEFDEEALLKQRKELDQKLDEILNLSSPMPAQESKATERISTAHSKVNPGHESELGDLAAREQELDQFQSSLAEFSARLHVLETPVHQIPSSELPSSLYPAGENSQQHTYQRTSSARPNSSYQQERPKSPSASRRSPPHSYSPGQDFSKPQDGYQQKSPKLGRPSSPHESRHHHEHGRSESHKYSNSMGVDDGSKAIIHALRTLQERVGKLEDEKLQAKEKIFGLEKELTDTRKLLLHQQATSQYYEPDYRGRSRPTSPKPDRYTQSRSPILPIPDRSIDHTMRDINDARQKVDILKERVDHVRNLADGSSSNAKQLGSSGYQPTALPDFLKKNDFSFETELDRHLRETAHEIQNKIAQESNERKKTDSVPPPPFDEILQRHSLDLLKESRSHATGKKSPSSPKATSFSEKSAEETRKPAWQEFPITATSLKTSQRSHKEKDSPSRQIENLKKEIESERQIRLGNVFL